MFEQEPAKRDPSLPKWCTLQANVHGDQLSVQLWLDPAHASAAIKAGRDGAEVKLSEVKIEDLPAYSHVRLLSKDTVAKDAWTHVAFAFERGVVRMWINGSPSVVLLALNGVARLLCLRCISTSS